MLHLLRRCGGIAAWAVICLASCALGCNSRDVLRAQGCDAGVDCGCRSNLDCALGLTCVNGACTDLAPALGLRGLAFGADCSADDECASGHCLKRFAQDGAFCTRACDGGCPEGWRCLDRLGGALCTPPVDRSCLPCEDDGDCNVAGDRCLELSDGRFCALACSSPADCPEGYECQSEGDSGQLCIPTGRSCGCAEAGDRVVACEQSNHFGTCFGQRRCDAAADSCSAAMPSDERCNGVDDDCDGFIDDEDASIDTGELPLQPPYPACGEGACRGRWRCEAGAWRCDVEGVTEEACNGVDDDCDGEVDEDFLPGGPGTAPAALEHCGACGLDCRRTVAHLRRGEDDAIEEGAVTCLPGEADAPPRCAVQQCEEGFVPFPAQDGLLCVPAVVELCQPCRDDGDCAVPGDRCVGLDEDQGARFCAPDCGAEALRGGCDGQTGIQGCCPSGGVCTLTELDGERARICLPAGGSCTCDDASDGDRRSCVARSSDEAACVGVQTCRRDPRNGVRGWSECVVTTDIPEICDGRDNDCDGEVDEDFIDTRGTGDYDSNAHCGACGVNCELLFDRSRLFAEGACLVAEDPPRCFIASCVDEWRIADQPCALDSDCAEGRCDATSGRCERACVDDTGCGLGERCIDQRCALSCIGDVLCRESFGSGGRCRDSICQLRFERRDADGVERNGCECAFPAGFTSDEPDIFRAFPPPGADYIDLDCDGVDGDVERALFVSQAAEGGGDGSIEAPFQRINDALEVYDGERNAHILVAEGSYVESLALRPGVRLYGGYAPDFRSRDLQLHPTILFGVEPPGDNPELAAVALRVEGARLSRTVISGFTIQGPDVAYRPPAGQRGRSSVAVLIADSGAALLFANNRVVAGRGGEGGDGLSGVPGGPGSDGGQGRNSLECGSPTCGGESLSGGAGGQNLSCPEAAGNPGGSSRGGTTLQEYQPPLNGNGRGGRNNWYRHANTDQVDFCKYDCTETGESEGGDGQPGAPGVAGRSGVACSAVLFALDNSGWRSSGGQSGGDGQFGDGGGGGGAGAGVDNQITTPCTIGNRVGDLGATGGGGGAGGCGGTGGGGGGSGGASIALLVVAEALRNDAPSILGNVIIRGPGGRGGNGGDGGDGGLGGDGGSGGRVQAPAFCGGGAGAGARGGPGGPGGGGAGGCGGPSYGIALSAPLTQSYQSRNRFEAPSVATGGTGGTGGSSPRGSDAPAGAAGEALQIRVAPVEATP